MAITTVTVNVERPAAQPITVHVQEASDGKSAYQSYLDTTTDDPPLSEAEWSAPAEAGASTWEEIDGKPAGLPPEWTPPLAHAIRVRGAGTPEANGWWVPVGYANSKPTYRKIANVPSGAVAAYPITLHSDEEYKIEWRGSLTGWGILGDTGQEITYYASTQDTATPDLVTTWTAESGTAPLPTVAGYIPALGGWLENGVLRGSLSVPAALTTDETTKTNLLNAFGGGATGKGLFAAGTVAAANEIVGLMTKQATQDLQRNTATTPTTDIVFTQALAANTKYKVEFALDFTTTTADGLKLQFTHPQNYINNNIPNSGSSWVATVFWSITNGATTTAIYSGTAYNGTRGAYGYFFLTTGASAGNLELQWSPNGGTGNVTRKAYSHVTVTKINP